MKVSLNYYQKLLQHILPPEYPYDVVGGARIIKQADFDDKNRYSTSSRS